MVMGSKVESLKFTDLNKRLLPRPKTPSHESLYPIGLKSPRIEITHIGFHHIDFSNMIFRYTKTALQ